MTIVYIKLNKSIIELNCKTSKLLNYAIKLLKWGNLQAFFTALPSSHLLWMCVNWINQLENLRPHGGLWLLCVIAFDGGYRGQRNFITWLPHLQSAFTAWLVGTTFGKTIFLWQAHCLSSNWKVGLWETKTSVGLPRWGMMLYVPPWDTPVLKLDNSCCPKFTLDVSLTSET